MATVVGTLEVQFETATLMQAVTRPIPDTLPIVFTPDPAPLDLWSLLLDVPRMVGEWGPVIGIEWHVEIAPTLVPLPSALGMMASAMGAVAFLVMRARVDEPGPSASRKPRGHRAT